MSEANQPTNSNRPADGGTDRNKESQQSDAGPLVIFERVDEAAIERTIAAFEEEWHSSVSDQGKQIIQLFFASLMLDRLGFAILMTHAMRKQAMKVAYGTLRGFLNHLGSVAAQAPISDPNPTVRGRPDQPEGPDEPQIGGLLIMQNVNNWADQIGCSCWPR
jgi:hypothetical protein